MDDGLFNEAAKSREFCQEVLRTIYGDPGLEVIENIPQATLTNLENRAVRLDTKCKLSDGRIIDIEVQKENNDDFRKRVRYNGAVLTTNVTLKGTDFRDVPDVCVIFISKFDPFKGGRAIYHARTALVETGEPVNDGYEAIYVNAKIDDKSDVSKLMKIFSDETTYDKNRFPVVSFVKDILKNGEKGNKNMSNLTAEIIKKGMEYNKEEIKRFYEDEFKEIFREEGKKKTLITSIKNLIDSLKITAEKAMDALKIKEEDREMYLKALQK